MQARLPAPARPAAAAVGHQPNGGKRMAMSGLVAAGGSSGGSVLHSDDDLIDIRHTGTTDQAKSPVLHASANGHNDSSAAAAGAVYNGDNGMDEGVPNLGQYDDFHTIDWQRDIARDRMRHR